MRSSSAKPALLFLFLCLLTAGVYHPGLSGDYMFDDMQNLLLNTRLDFKTLDLESLQAASFSSGSGLLHRPVSMASFALNRYFFGLDPYSHKIVNLVIHLLTGTGLLLLGRLLLKSYRACRHPDLSPAVVTWLPVIVSGIWLVHPLNLTSVLYIVQRMTSLATLFTVLGLCCYTYGRYRLTRRDSGWTWILGGLFLFGALAVLSKENGALLPLYMLVIEMAVFRFRDSENRLDPGVAIFFVLFLLLPACGFLLWLASQPGAFLGGYLNRSFTLVERLMTEARVLVFYLKQIFMPSLTELGLYHDDIAISRSLLNPVTTLPAIIMLAILLSAALLLVRKLPLVSLGILWFFAGHVLESTILPLEIAHEHRNYLADYGIIFSACAATLQIRSSALLYYGRAVVPVLLLAVFSYSTWVRAEQWSDNVNHAIIEAVHHPESPRAIFSAGRIHARLAINGHKESADRAFSYLQQAGELDNSGILPEVVMIKLAHVLKLPVKDTWYQRIIEKLGSSISAADLNALHILGQCQQSVCKTPRSTMETIYRTALDNDSLNGARRRGHAYTSYGYYLINGEGEFLLGRDYFIKAVETSPGELQNWINLLKLLLNMKDYESAEKWLVKFRAAGVKGATDKDYHRFQKSIEKGRVQHTPGKAIADKGVTTGN
jgi:hypothetical protein